MTIKAWLVTKWGSIRETLQPELFALRNALRTANAARRTQAEIIGRLQAQVDEQAVRLAARSRELKVLRAKLKRAGK
jgi:hypothetical protein